MDEVEQCLLNRIRDLGKGLTENIEGTWFIDLNHCVGRWEGCVLYVYGLFVHEKPATDASAAISVWHMDSITRSTALHIS